MTTGTYEYKSEYARRYYSRGQAKGEAKALLTLLDARGIAVPEPAAARVSACTDLAQLTEWVQRAATANSLDQVFGD